MKRLIKLSFAIAAVSMAATSCNCYKKMGKKVDEVNVVCSPEVLTLNNGKVDAEISVEIPAKYFKKTAVLRVTPVIVYQGGEVAADPIMLQGEKVQENFKVVDYSEGTTIKESVSFKYTPEMRRSKLQLRIEAICKCSECDEFVLLDVENGAAITMSEMETLESEPNSEAAQAILRRCGYNVADGVNTLQGDFDYAEMMDDMQDNYKRVTTTVETVDVNYGINSSVVSSKSVKNENVDAFKAIVAGNIDNDRAKQTLYANGYASPDGPETFNDKLSKARSESSKKAMDKILKEYGLDIDAAAYGEDWDGFKKLVEESNIADKNLILQVLSLHDSSTQREAEIKNLSEVFNELKSEILPQLRRAQMSNKIDLTGKTDEEMLALVADKKYSELNVEEVLHICANLDVEDCAKVALLEYASKEFSDARAYNNLAILYAKNGENSKADAAFAAAVKNGAEGVEANKNMALMSLENGDVAGAEQFVKGADAEAEAAIAAATGDYTKAVKQMSGYNAAIAYTQSENYAAAKAALKGDNSADADYLMAVIASKEGDVKTAGAKLSSALKKDKSLAEKAADDVNLKNLFESGFKM